MLSKCANPSCSASFFYLHEGKLFRSDTPANQDAPTQDTGMKKTSRRIEFFWLCADCAPKMTLRFKVGEGVTVQPNALAQASGL
jgi:hypothetical protein